MYKLIAIDLDGTLLNSQKKISEENKKTIQRAREKGVKIIVCSGRIYSGARDFAGQLFLKEPLIACNGAIIRDVLTNEDLYNNPLSKEDCFRVIDICHKAGIYFHAYVGDIMYTEKLNFSSLYYWEKNKELPHDQKVEIALVKNVKNSIEDCAKKASKIVVISDDLKKLRKVRTKVQNISTTTAMSSNYNNFEVVNYEVSKGNALKFLSEKLNIKREEIMAIGDNENDYSMIEFAGLGVAMGNAEIGIKEIADFITSSNDENGVAVALKKYIL